MNIFLDFIWKNNCRTEGILRYILRVDIERIKIFYFDLF